MTTANRNLTHLVLFLCVRNGMMLRNLARELYPGNSRFLLEAYDMATSQPYGYLYIDFRPEISKNQRLLCGIFHVSSSRSPSFNHLRLFLRKRNKRTHSFRMMTNKVTIETLSFLIVISKSSKQTALKLAKEAFQIVSPTFAEICLNAREKILGEQLPKAFKDNAKLIERIIEKKYSKAIKLRALTALVRSGAFKKILAHCLERLDVR